MEIIFALSKNDIGAKLLWDLHKRKSHSAFVVKHPNQSRALARRLALESSAIHQLQTSAVELLFNFHIQYIQS